MEKHVPDDGEEPTSNPTMAGRIFKIVVTKPLPRREYAIVDVFNVSGSKDSRYGMPTMHANRDYGYQTILPSVSRNFLQVGPVSLSPNRPFHSSSTLNMTAKVESVATQSAAQALRAFEQRQRSPER